MQLDPGIERLSPLHDRHQILGAHFTHQAGWLIPEFYTDSDGETTVLQDTVGLSDISAKGKLIVKGSDANAIITPAIGKSPTEIGEILQIETNHLLVAKLTVDEFLILTTPGLEQEIIASLETEISAQNTFVSVLNQTSGLVGFLLAGPESASMLSKLCALDFNPINFPDWHVVQSSFAKVRTTIIRHDRNDSPTFELFADRSYADYLWDAILDAGLEFGIKPVGWMAMEQ